MRVFINVFMANFKELIRDKSALFWFLAFPLFFVFIFGMVFSGNSEPTYNLGIIIEEPSPMSQGIVEGISSIPGFNVSVAEGEGRGELEALKNGGRSVVLKLPVMDENKMSTTEIPLYYDKSKQQSSQILISIVKEIFNQVEHRITGRQPLFEINPEPIQAQNITNLDFILPGILAMALMQLGLFGSLQFLELREKKIIRGLGVTPLSRITLIISEIALRVLMAVVQTILILTIGVLVFNLKIEGNLLTVFGVVILGSMTFISLGYMLINCVKSVEGGNGLIQMVQFPMMFLSGIFFPAEIMPSYIQPVIKAIPLSYLGDMLRQVMIGMNSGVSLTTDFLVLSGWLVGSLIIAIKFWRWD